MNITADRRVASGDDHVSEQLGQLETAGLADLRRQWAELFGHPAPSVFQSRMLAQAIAHKLQANQFGDVTLGQHLRTPQKAVATPEPGPRLIRSWRGKVYEVTSLDDAFELDGVRYRSLTAVAKAITGTHWNGLAFFGVKDRADLARRRATGG